MYYVLYKFRPAFPNLVRVTSGKHPLHNNESLFLHQRETDPPIFDTQAKLTLGSPELFHITAFTSS